MKRTLHLIRIGRLRGYFTYMGDGAEASLVKLVMGVGLIGPNPPEKLTVELTGTHRSNDDGTDQSAAS